MARKRARRNKKKKRSAARLRRFKQQVLLATMMLGGGVALLLISATFIISYDVLIHSDGFPVEKIAITGAKKLSQQDILRRAGVHLGGNILAVNLSALRKNLISHPWIADAQVRREVPGRLWIRIREHQCIAVVDLGDKFLLNQDGYLFKQWQPKLDPKHLPIVRGLAAADLQVAGRPRSAKRSIGPGSAEAVAGNERYFNGPLTAVMQILRLGQKKGSIVRNSQIKRIEVDREMGLTLLAFRKPKLIKLGYDDYPKKYRMLATVMAQARGNRLVPDFTHIDLQDIRRIVIKPIRQQPA